MMTPEHDSMITREHGVYLVMGATLGLLTEQTCVLVSPTLEKQVDRRGLRPSAWAVMEHACYHQQLSREKKKINDGKPSSILGLDTMIQDFRLVNVGQGQFVVLASRYRLPLVITDISASPDRPRPLIDTRFSLYRARALTLPESSW